MTPATRRFQRRSPIAFRRSPYVVSYWLAGQLVVFNYATGAFAEATPLALEVLDSLKEWRTWKDLSATWLRDDRKLLRQLVDLMVKRTFVMRSVDSPRTIERGLERWGTWNPVAALFHLATKDVQFVSADVDQQAVSCEKARSEPVPASLKAGARGIPLPKPITEGQLPSVLLERRTWRRFGAGSLALDNLATLLQLTWGVHGWLEVPGVSRFALKTSPSGGARHSIEVYVIIRKVAGLRRGLYHYNPDTHRLVPIKGGGPRRISDYLPGQPWFDEAGALMLMTSVFDRVQWRYPYARAYRAILAEAGHLCQTFCLVSTWLGLAPFCTMALADSRIERDLAIDGVSESVIYAAGVGIRPSGVNWAPLPGTNTVPRTFKPAHTRQRG
jgi:SagB-type dehydrogenase family enzyme